MTKEGLYQYIDNQADEFHQAGDDAWLYEMNEMKVIYKIFWYCVDENITFERYDLRRILEADDDEEFPEGRHEMLYELMRRISGESKETIDAPGEVKDLLMYYKKSFYPDFYSS